MDTLHHLEGVTDADTALVLLERALELAQLHTVPNDRAAYALFVCGPLFDAIAEQLGEAVAARTSEELTGLDASAPSAETPPAPARVVIVASVDAARADALAAELGVLGPVHRAPDLVSLVSRVEENLGQPILLVVDGAIPGLDGAMLPTLARLLPADSKIVHCGDPPSGLYDTSLTWATLAESAAVEEVVAQCREPGAPRGRS